MDFFKIFKLVVNDNNKFKAFLVIIVFIITAICYVSNTTSSNFETIDGLNVPRNNHTATLLKDGKVLIVGGVTDRKYSNKFNEKGIETKIAELYEPAKKKFIIAGKMNEGRWFHSANLLKDGRVLVVGGLNNDNVTQKINYLSSVEIYNPKTGTFNYAGNMHYPRYNHKSLLLKDGRVLIYGGCHSKKSINCGKRLEIYNPKDGKFYFTGSMEEARGSIFTATLLKDGRVLITGGFNEKEYEKSYKYLKSAEIYNPDTNRFTLINNMKTPRLRHSGTLLKDGKVLITGGAQAHSDAFILDSVELFDVERQRFSAINGSFKNYETGKIIERGILKRPRINPYVIELQNGNIFIASENTNLIEIHSSDMKNLIWQVEDVVNGRHYYTATLLNDGNILFAGGTNKQYKELNFCNLFKFGNIGSRK